MKFLNSGFFMNLLKRSSPLISISGLFSFHVFCHICRYLGTGIFHVIFLNRRLAVRGADPDPVRSGPLWSDTDLDPIGTLAMYGIQVV